MSAEDVGAPGAPPGMAPGPVGANPGSRMFVPRMSKGDIPPSGLKPHTDTLKEFPYIGTPHQKAG